MILTVCGQALRTELARAFHLAGAAIEEASGLTINIGDMPVVRDNVEAAVHSAMSTRKEDKHETYQLLETFRRIVREEVKEAGNSYPQVGR